MTLMLRPYQQEAIDALLKAEGRGIRRPLLALPTGTGKTVVFADLIRQRQGRSLVLVHRDELIQQAAEKLRLIAPGLEVGIVKAAKNEVDAPCVLASVQTLSRESRLARLPLGFETVIKVACPSTGRVLAARNPTSQRWGKGGVERWADALVPYRPHLPVIPLEKKDRKTMGGGVWEVACNPIKFGGRFRWGCEVFHVLTQGYVFCGGVGVRLGEVDVRGWSAGEEMDGLHEGLRGADGQGGRALLNLK